MNWNTFGLALLPVQAKPHRKVASLIQLTVLAMINGPIENICISMMTEMVLV